MIVTDIIWDVDEGEGIEFFYGLPNREKIPKGIEENEIGDYLGIKYGFHVYSFSIVKESEEVLV